MAGNIVPRSDGGSNLGTSSKEFNVIYAKSFGGTIAGQVVTKNSPVFTGTPAAPTAAAGTNTTQLATTAFANSAGAAAASSAVATHNAATDAHSGIIASAISTHNSGVTAHEDIRTKITTDIATHNSAAGAHSDIRTALTGKADSSALANYLPRSGGAITGTNFCRDTDSSFIEFYGASSSSNGALLALFGKDYTSASGMFSLRAQNGTVIKNLDGDTSGNLTWDSKSIDVIAAQGDGYIRYTNGLQLCWGRKSISGTADTISFGAAFSAKPSAVCCSENSFTQCTINAATSNANIYTQSAVTVAYLAIGRWI